MKRWKLSAILLVGIALFFSSNTVIFAQEQKTGEMDWLRKWASKLDNIFSTSLDVGLQSSFVNTKGFLKTDAQSQFFRFDGYGVQFAIHFDPKAKSTLGLFVSYAQMANNAIRNAMIVPEASSTQMGMILSNQIHTSPKRKVYWIQQIGASQMNLGYGAESLDKDRIKRWGLGIQEAVKYYHAFSEHVGVNLKAYINLSAYWGKVREHAPLKPTHSVELGLTFSVSIM